MFNLHLTERHGSCKISRAIEHIRKCKTGNPIGIVSYLDQARDLRRPRPPPPHRSEAWANIFLMLLMWSIQSLCTTPNDHCSFTQHNLRIIALIQQTQVSYLACLWCIISRMGCFCFSVCCLQSSHSCRLWRKQESAVIPDIHCASLKRLTHLLLVM
jgi:hypothetical protein